MTASVQPISSDSDSKADLQATQAPTRRSVVYQPRAASTEAPPPENLSFCDVIRLVLEVFFNSAKIFFVGIFLNHVGLELIASIGYGAEVDEDGRTRTKDNDSKVWIGSFIYYGLTAIPVDFSVGPLYVLVVASRADQTLFESFRKLPFHIPLVCYLVFLVTFAVWRNEILLFSMVPSMNFVFIRKVGRMFNSNIGIQMIKVVCTLTVVNVSLHFTNVVSFIKSQDDNTKIVLNVFVVPIIREVGYTTLRFISAGTMCENQRADVALLKFYSIYMALFTRFLFMAMETYSGMVTNLLASALMELAVRTTYVPRERICLRIWNAALQAFNFEPWPNYIDSLGYKAHVARVLLLDSQAEFIAIITTPALFLLNQSTKNRLMLDLGYDGLEPIDTTKIVLGFAVSLMLELVVDGTCMNVESRVFHYPIREEWRLRYHGYNLVLWLTSLFAQFVILLGFARPVAPCQDTDFFCMCLHEKTYESGVRVAYCADWLERTNNGTDFGLNATRYGFASPLNLTSTG